MAKTLTMLNTIKGSLLEGFYPKGWDLKRIDACCAMGLKRATKPAATGLRGQWRMRKKQGNFFENRE